MSIKPFLFCAVTLIGICPPAATAAEQGGQTTISAKQSRFNIDFKSDTTKNAVRVFLEGDFFGSGDGGFTLRHAYGSWKGLLGGQTWTTFMDISARAAILGFAEHWTRRRSTTLSGAWAEIDNNTTQPATAIKEVISGHLNLICSPHPNVDLGGGSCRASARITMTKRARRCGFGSSSSSSLADRPTACRR